LTHVVAQRPTRASHDAVVATIGDYVCNEKVGTDLARETARYCLLDALSCAFEALDYAACTKLLGPIVPGATLSRGARVPGTSFELDPVQAAFNLGAMIRWLDFNDTWLAAEWGHPSDNIGAILTCADFLARRESEPRSVSMREVIDATIKAYEIQGILALENGFNRVGLDHVLLVRVATAAVATLLLGGDEDEVRNAVSNAWLDGGALRTYRHAPNTGSRKSWAAGDAAARGVWLALLARRGEMGYSSPLSTPRWGFCDALNRGKQIVLARPLASYVIENILFKVSYPAEFHAQTAVEAAIRLHPYVEHRLDAVEQVTIETQEPGVRIIDKTGPLGNPADRDHCIQYMVAVPLLFGRLTARDYEDKIAADPRIDALRAKMVVREHAEFTRDYYAPDKRYIGNAVQVSFKDGSSSERVEISCPIGHRERREEAVPLLLEKCERNIRPKVAAAKWTELWRLATDQNALEGTPIDRFVDLLTP
jgi:2-methylcitrate dehydratase